MSEQSHESVAQPFPEIDRSLDPVVSPAFLRDIHKPEHGVANKRIIVCCDGTWNDGLGTATCSGYTNILRIARALRHYDDRGHPNRPVHQVVYYTSGVGTRGFIDSLAGGITGAGLLDKIEEAYAFICANWVPGDEIFLFGFSRGAFTVRMIAGLIGEIGILERVGMEAFPHLYLALQRQGKIKKRSPQAIRLVEHAERILMPFRERAQAQINAAPDGFLIKVVGVFDTVGALGLPKGVVNQHLSPKGYVLGFSNTTLGKHIHHAFHALAMDETRSDFMPTKWEKSPNAHPKPILKQVWFAGAHSDIGGGYEEHDLSDITLGWMIAKTREMLYYIIDYIKDIPEPTQPYGQLKPHDSATWYYRLLRRTQRRHLPRRPPEAPTWETVHESVLSQAQLPPELGDLRNNLSLLEEFDRDGVEAAILNQWPYPTPYARRCTPTHLAVTAAQMTHSGSP